VAKVWPENGEADTGWDSVGFEKSGGWDGGDADRTYSHVLLDYGLEPELAVSCGTDFSLTKATHWRGSCCDWRFKKV
jgi:hypothetical protein